MNALHRMMQTIALGILSCSSCGELEDGGPGSHDDCTLAADLGSVDVVAGTIASAERRLDGGIRLSLPVGSDVTDRLTLELHPNEGTLGEIVPGTYEIAGPELDYVTCGVCAYAETDMHPDSTGRFEMATDYFWARSGSLVVHDVDGRFIADLHGLELATRDGRCASAIELLAIDVGPDAFMP